MRLEKLSPTVLLVLSGLLYTVVHAAVKAVSHLPVSEVILFRSVISLALTYLALRRVRLHPLGKHRKMLVLRGIFGTLALILYFYTLQRMPLATAVTIQYLHPILTVILATWAFQEKPAVLQWLCLAVSFIGVLAVKGIDTRVELFDLSLGILSAFFSACAYSLIRASRGKDDPLVVIFYFPLVSVPLVLPFAIHNWVSPIGWDWAVLISIGIFNQIAQYFLTLAYQADKAANISNLNFLNMVYGLIIGLFVFGEAVLPSSFVGMALIVASAIFSVRLAHLDRIKAKTSG